MSDAQCTPQDARASTRDEQEESWRRFNEAFRAFYPLVDTDCQRCAKRLERVGELMDEWARRLAS